MTLPRCEGGDNELCEGGDNKYHHYPEKWCFGPIGSDMKRGRGECTSDGLIVWQ